MYDLKTYLKSKVFVINTLILNNINKLNISLNEFLLLLYFINIKNEFDIEDIKKYLSFKDEEILNTFNDLIKNTFIEIKVLKEKDIIKEEISLDPFYNKLTLSIPVKEEKSNDIFSLFEKEFGRMLSPMEFESINLWIENKVPEEVIKKALREAVLSGTPNIRYIDKIIYQHNKSLDKTQEFKPLFDYDWLEDNDK